MYCLKCGKPLPQEANFCPVCGAAVQVSKEAVENSVPKLLKKSSVTGGFAKEQSVTENRSSMIYNVKITQKKQKGMNHPKIKLLVNDKYEELVTQEMPCSLQLEPGVNRIQFTYWVRTTIIEFDLDYDISFEAKFNRLMGYIDITSTHPFRVILKK